jgi:hypothetical protein
MNFFIMFLLILGTAMQSVQTTPSKPTVEPLFLSRGVDIAPAFLVECRNTTSEPVSSGSSRWPHTDSAIRVDGRVLPDPPGGHVPQGLTMDIQPGSTWRGIIELWQSPSGRGWKVELGAHTRMFIYVPLSAGRHTVGVRCADVWSDDVAFYWEK